MSAWNAGDVARPGAGSQDDDIGAVAALVGHDTAGTSARDVHFPDRMVLVQ